MSATPEFKILMDNQFKNVKTHARLLSKAMWYEWRTQLQDGLKEGLVKIADDMDSDDQLLQKQQKLLDSVLPTLSAKVEALQAEHDNLQSIAQELADCDPEDLQAARTDLTEVDADIRAKMQKIKELEEQLDETESSISHLSQMKQECVAGIEEAEKIREECRGWTSNEISSLKGQSHLHALFFFFFFFFFFFLFSDANKNLSIKPKSKISKSNMAGRSQALLIPRSR